MPSNFLKASDGVVVAELLRDGITESFHHGVMAVVDSDGATLLERGNPDAIVYPRSTLKPFQALAVLATGIELSPLELALTSASHCGSLRHRDAIGNFLNRWGLSASQLQCPEDWPLGVEERAQMLASDGAPSRLAMNCSGKHAGFLAACIHAGCDPSTYLESGHPLQKLIVDTISTYTGEAPAFTSRDGCGAPLHALSVRSLARGLAKLVQGTTDHEKALLSAVANNAWALDGDGRDNTVTIETLGGIAKIGAEGLVVIAVPSGVAVALKILDGSMRATSLVALASLAKVGAISESAHNELAARMAFPVKGGEATVGGLKVRL